MRDKASGRIIGGRYRLIAELGSGGMGVTYRAWDMHAGAPVVVKMPKPEKQNDPVLLARFAREIEAMQSVPHRSIVPITTAEKDAGVPFVVMRFLPGGSLADYRRREEGSPPGMLHFWLPDVAAALDHIHGRGLVHRDVKPANIFLDGFLRPYLGDFGIAKFIDQSADLADEQTLTATTSAVGTLEYMAPELFRPKPSIDGRSDQYALAVTAYEMLAGWKPFNGQTAHLIVEQVSLAAPPLEARCPGLPRRACEAVHRALSKDPNARFPSCAAFTAAVLEDIPRLELEPGVVRLLCPHCRNILKLSQRAAGRDGRCPRCNTTIDVAEDLGSLWLKTECRTGTADGFVQPTSTEAGNGVPPGQRVGTGMPGDSGVIAFFVLMVALTGGHLTGNLLRVPLFIQAGVAVAVIATYVMLRQAQRRDDSQVPSADTDVPHFPVSLSVARSPTAQALSKEASPVPRALNQGRVQNAIGLELTACPPGSFVMGDANGRRDEIPHRVTVTAPFLIGVHPVTYGQWCQVMGTAPDRGRGQQCPATRISWDDAVDFCRRLTQLPQERDAGRVYRLPTEAEWEYACRAGSTSTYPWGADATRLADYGWYVGNSGGKLHDVGHRKPNQWGISDMLGSVWEWCHDWYSDDYYDHSPSEDPRGPDSGSQRVIRGGGWGDQAKFCRSSVRGREHPETHGSGIGFRVACTVECPQH